LSGFQSLSKFHEVPHKELKMFNSAVSPVANLWARVTRIYQNDPPLHQFIHVTPDQLTGMWNRYDRELDSFHSELVVHRIVNKDDKNRTRLTIYKEDLEGLRVGNWVGNTIIDVFACKTFNRLNRSGVT
jgi:hypothetical protein